MNNAEMLKSLADRNCLNCKFVEKKFKSSKHTYCTNTRSPLVNKETYGNMWCDEFEKKEEAKR